MIVEIGIALVLAAVWESLLQKPRTPRGSYRRTGERVTHRYQGANGPVKRWNQE